jgi:predicted dehydrogenase
LQARSAPVFRYLRDLITDGYVGEVLSTSIVASGFSWGGSVASAGTAFSLDATNGVSMLTVPMGHTLDAAAFLLGELTDVTATVANRRPLVVDEETGQLLPMTVADQVAVTGRFASGAVASVHFRGGLNRSTNLLWEINGTEGDLLITGAMGHVQLVDLTVKGVRGNGDGLVELEVPASYQLVEGVPPGARISNVANAYALLREDWATGSAHVPTFDHSVLRHRTIDAIAQAGGMPVA